MGNASLMSIAESEAKVLRKLLLRALNENQRLILQSINGKHRSLNAFLEELSKKENRPISTLKLNARILKELGLIEYGTKDNPKPVTLTEEGRLVLRLLEGDGYGE
ncbi:hypothetical protein [Pyrococcus kukulkanii]|uniref:ArnR1-like winged helix-turn-helix domain-containing protein n=2 Tax=Pyrococcus kukulkanii TaxID=1609559 RepID=A0A127BAT8_9EURY|nr:hypothetical protein TQ32_08200 [Pyrococcus kukulkanii]